MKATKGQFEAFVDSFVWQDMLDELDVWESLARSEFEEAASLRKVGNIQGRLEAIKWLRRLPQLLMETLEEESKLKNSTNSDELIVEDVDEY